MAGSYVICELASVQKEFPQYQQALAQLEAQIIAKCNVDWAPKTLGYLTPSPSEYGRTSWIPRLFVNQLGVTLTTWRQLFTTPGVQVIFGGNQAGNTIPKDWKLAWIGLLFANGTQHLTEINYQIADRRYERVNLEEVKEYTSPALIFKQGYVIDEQTTFVVNGYMDFLTTGAAGITPRQYQRIIPLGALYYRYLDKLLGNPGAVIV
jgi:hypothetical protein